jgi:hypothetical protein
MATKTITIRKVDHVVEIPKTEEKKPEPKSIMKKGGKTMKTFPKGVLKTMKHKPNLKPVSDPAKPPPLKKTMKKHVIQLMTEKGVRRHRKTLKNQISKMSNEKVKELVVKNGLLKNVNTPPSIMREMLEGGAIAGFISLN